MFNAKNVPSRAHTYPVELDTINLRLELDSIMDVSEAATLNDDKKFVEAMCNSFGIASTVLTVGDFYALTLLARSTTFTTSLIKWTDVVCNTPKITIPESAWQDEQCKAVLERHGVKRVNILPRDKMLDMFSAVDKDLQKPLDLSRHTDLCRHNNQFEMSVELIERNFVMAPETVEFETGFTFPTANLIPEWKKLTSDPRYSKLLQFVVWLDSSYGITIAEKFATLGTMKDPGDIIAKAADYNKRYTHGPAVIMSDFCEACGTELQLKPISIGSQLFFA